MTAADTHRTIETIWRIERPRLVAVLTRLTRDLDAAEDLAQEALVAALEQWPVSGVPDNPAAWLTATAKHHGIDLIRRRARLDRLHGGLAHEMSTVEPSPAERIHAELDDDIGDALLALMFVSCHPVLSSDARVALTLRLLGGLTTQEIARAFLVAEPTIAQRIVRAKKTIAGARLDFEVPRGPDRAARLASVLDVVYLIFNEGYTASSGDDWMRPALCEEAMRLGRVLAGLMPGEGEVHGLVALMELQASRTRARTDAAGRPVLLADQNRALWDPLLIRRGLAALAVADRLGASHRGPYTVQAAIAACHATARRSDDTDWPRVAALYAVLATLAPSPIVELNRAVAVAMAFGPEAGLAIVDAIRSDPALQTYHLLPSVRADLLMRLGRREEARLELARAVELTRNDRERDLLMARLRECEREMES